MHAGARLTCKRVVASGQYFGGWKVGEPIHGEKRARQEEDVALDEPEQEGDEEEDEEEDDHHGEIYLFEIKALTPKFAEQVRREGEWLKEWVQRLATKCKATVPLPVYAEGVPAAKKKYYHDAH